MRRRRPIDVNTLTPPAFLEAALLTAKYQRAPHNGLFVQQLQWRIDVLGRQCPATALADGQIDPYTRSLYLVMTDSLQSAAWCDCLLAYRDKLWRPTMLHNFGRLGDAFLRRTAISLSDLLNRTPTPCRKRFDDYHDNKD